MKELGLRGIKSLPGFIERIGKFLLTRFYSKFFWGNTGVKHSGTFWDILVTDGCPFKELAKLDWFIKVKVSPNFGPGG